jgi:APA family basic amino acid/polyamine antiporter
MLRPQSLILPIVCLHAVVTSMNLIAVVYVLAAGAPFGDIANLSPFAPFGARGIFAGVHTLPGRSKARSSTCPAGCCRPGHLRVVAVLAGASIIYFAFVGFDSVATVAEEVLSSVASITNRILLCDCMTLWE